MVPFQPLGIRAFEAFGGAAGAPLENGAAARPVHDPQITGAGFAVARIKVSDSRLINLNIAVLKDGAGDFAAHAAEPGLRIRPRHATRALHPHPPLTAFAVDAHFGHFPWSFHAGGLTVKFLDVEEAHAVKPALKFSIFPP